MRGGAAGAQDAPVGVVVVAAVGVDLSWLAARPPSSAADRRDGVQQRDELGDVVAVPAGEGHRQRDAAGVADQVVLAARLAAVDRGWADVVPSLSARTWEPSTAQRSRSRRSSARSSARSSSCRSSSCRTGQTPASVQSRSRRQQVTPEQPTRLVGSWFQAMPVLSTNTIPASAARSSTGRRPGCRYRRGFGGGSKGSTRCHSPLPQSIGHQFLDHPAQLEHDEPKPVEAPVILKRLQAVETLNLWGQGEPRRRS